MLRVNKNMEQVPKGIDCYQDIIHALEKIRWKNRRLTYFCPICYAELSDQTCPTHGIKVKFADHFRRRKLDDEMKARIKDVLALVDSVAKDFGGIVECVVKKIGNDAGAIRITTAFGTVFEYSPRYDALEAYLMHYYSDHVLDILKVGAAELRLALYVEVPYNETHFKPVGTVYDPKKDAFVSFSAP
jgi:hypothetical protein